MTQEQFKELEAIVNTNDIVEEFFYANANQYASLLRQGQTWESYIKEEGLDEDGDTSIESLIRNLQFLNSGVCVKKGAEDNDIYTIWKFYDVVADEMCYIKFYGWYASHCGSEFNKMLLVEPVQKMIIDYQTVNFK